MLIAARVAAIAWSMADDAFEFLFAVDEGGGVPWWVGGTAAALGATAPAETGTVPGRIGTGGKLMPGLNWLGTPATGGPDVTTDDNGVICMGWVNTGLDIGTEILTTHRQINY